MEGQRYGKTLTDVCYCHRISYEAIGTRHDQSAGLVKWKRRFATVSNHRNLIRAFGFLQSCVPIMLEIT